MLSGAQRVRLGLYGGARQPYASFAGKGEAPIVVVSALDPGAGSGKYPNEEDVIRWLQSLFPQHAHQIVTPKIAKKFKATPPQERKIVVNAAQWLRKDEGALKELVRESGELRGAVDAYLAYQDALADFAQYEQESAKERARRAVIAMMRQIDDEEALKLILEAI